MDPIAWAMIHLNGQIQGTAGSRLFTVWGDEYDDWYFTVEEPGQQPLTFGEYEGSDLAVTAAESWQRNHQHAGVDTPTR